MLAHMLADQPECRVLLPKTDPDSLVLRQFTHCLLVHLLYSSPDPKEGIGPTLNK